MTSISPPWIEVFFAKKALWHDSFFPPHNVNWFKKGKWVHVAKRGFEKYFPRKMKKGTSEPVYEKYILKALGKERLKE